MNPLISAAIYAAYADNPDGNVVFSPASYLEAIHQLLLCVKGDNLKELLVALDMSDDDIKSQIISFKQSLAELQSYNTLLCAEEYRPVLNSEVVRALQNLGSNLTSFTTPESAIETVNRIVREKTHGKIDNLVSRKNVNELTKFIILNCAYFKREWVHPLNPQWYDSPFHGSSKETSVKFLHELGNFRYYEDETIDIVEMPYKGTDICGYLFIPRESGLFMLMSNFRAHYAKIGSVAHRLEVDLTVPPFKIETTMGLVPSAKTAGVKSVFQWNRDWRLVDFDFLKSEAVLCVQDIVQKAYIDFTKDGTEATAATAILIGISGCMLRSEPPPVKYVRADKPFLFCLADKNHKDTPIFFGAINNL